MSSQSPFPCHWNIVNHLLRSKIFNNTEVFKDPQFPLCQKGTFFFFFFLSTDNIWLRRNSLLSTEHQTLLVTDYTLNLWIKWICASSERHKGVLGSSAQVFYIVDSSVEMVMVNEACHLPSPLYWVRIGHSLALFSCLRVLGSTREKRKKAS